MQSNDQIVFGSPVPGVSYTFRPAAYVVIVSEKGEIAFIEGKRGYFLPGGGSDDGETPEETTIRELREEFGYEIELGERIGTVTQYFVSAEEGGFRMSATFFAAALGSKCSDDGEYEVRWIDQSKVEELFYHQSHVWAIRQVIG